MGRGMVVGRPRWERMAKMTQGSAAEKLAIARQIHARHRHAGPAPDFKRDLRAALVAGLDRFVAVLEEK